MEFDQFGTLFKASSNQRFEQGFSIRNFKTLTLDAEIDIRKMQVIVQIRKHRNATRCNTVQQASRNRFNKNHLESPQFHKFQLDLASGSGPGGRWFKSIRLDCDPAAIRNL
jgi:hypothetical protein